jgi:hypothetical protein
MTDTLPFATHIDSKLRSGASASLPQIYVYKDDNFQGDGAQFLGGGVSELGPIGWDDKISSIVVISGTWRFYWDYRFGGDYLELAPGTYPSVEQVGRSAAAHPGPKPGWNDQISSFQPIAW